MQVITCEAIARREMCDAHGVASAVRASDRSFWASVLRARGALQAADLGAVEAHLAVVELGVGEAFLRAGERASRVAIVRSGILREAFPLANGGERTRGFAVAGDFAGSLSDLLRAEPARTGVVAEVATRVLTLPWSLVTTIAVERPAWRELLHRVTEGLYLAKAEREYELLALDAEDRYDRFRARYPGLEAHVTQRHVASYLGITPEHLSRIRARRRRATKGERR